MTIDPDPSNSPNGAPAIRIVDLCRHYQMGEALIRAVDGVSLQIRRESLWLCWGVPGPASLPC